MTPSTPAPAEGAVNALAEAWASIDGKLAAYLGDDGSDPLLGFRDGYQSDAASMIERLEKRGFTVAARPTPPVAGEVAEVIEVLTKKLHGYRPNDTWREIKVKASYLNSALDLLSRLSAGQGSSGAESGWRGIESAPRDGTRVWVARHVSAWGWVLGLAFYEDFKGIAGWIPLSAASDPPGVLGLAEPTHWVPLPEPPALDSPVSRNGEEG